MTGDRTALAIAAIERMHREETARLLSRCRGVTDATYIQAVIQASEERLKALDAALDALSAGARDAPRLTESEDLVRHIRQLVHHAHHNGDILGCRVASCMEASRWLGEPVYP